MHAAAADFPIQGIYEIHSLLDDGFVIDEKHCTEPEISPAYAQELSNGLLQLYRPLQVKQQEFYLEMISAHACRIINLHSGKYLAQGERSVETVYDKASGTSIEVVTASVILKNRSVNADPASSDGDAGSASAISREEERSLIWSMVSRPDGSFLLGSADGLYLTLVPGYAYNGAVLSLTSFSGEDNQKWQFTPAPVYAADTADTDSVNPYEEDGPLHRIQITLQFHDRAETLTAEKLAAWMVPGENHGYVLDESRLSDYITGLAERYNTVGAPRSFYTSYHTTITLYKGNFGWKLDEEKMRSILKDTISRPGNRTLFPIWSHKGAVFAGPNSDIGDSYVEVDLTAQKVWLYKDGECILETPCVSGTEGTSRETPGGVYSIYYMQAPAVLTGEDYSSPVDYWMPFNGGIGLHDASWRSEFGGTIYKSNGSHGCINLPRDAAKQIYETVEIGYPVVCYRE